MKNSIIKCLKSFQYAWKGVVYVLLNENNMRFHILASISIVLIGYFLKFTLNEWIATVISIGMVWAAEIFNTAIEKLVDIISPQHDPRAGLVKDISSGAVLVLACMALVVGIILVISKF